jgi:hypothetical protein
VQLIHGDCLAVLPTLPAASVDAVVTDPPYELAFMGKRWDQSGVAFRPSTWEAVPAPARVAAAPRRQRPLTLLSVTYTLQ